MSKKQEIPVVKIAVGQKFFVEGIPTPFAKLDVHSIKYDPSYQRPLTSDNWKHIRDNFDPLALGLPVVCKRKNSEVGGGHNYGVDGQHRVCAIIERLKLGMPNTPTNILCEYHENTTVEQEAKLFVERNKNHPVSGNNKIRANLNVKDSLEQQLEKIVIRHGFELGIPQRGGRRSCDNNKLMGAPAILKAWKDYPKQFEMSLTILRGAYNNKPFALKGNFIEGLCHFAMIYNIEKDDLPRIIRNLSKTDPHDAKYYVESGNRPGPGVRLRRIAQWFANNSGFSQPIAA